VETGVLLDIRDLRKYFPVYGGLFRKVVGHVRAVDGVSFTIGERETLGLVGESGCGKSTLGRAILRLHEPTSGEIRFHDDGTDYSLCDLDKQLMRKMRLKMQIIFQDPISSLNERMTVMENIVEPLVVNRIGTRSDRRDRAVELLVQVGLEKDHLRRYPHSFSGGQRQRIGLARALATNPKFIVADEPVSALDVSIQAHILELIKKLKSEFHLTMLFISHDLGVIRYVSDRIAVMYMGRIVEIAPRDELLSGPHHPYTEALLSAVPKADPEYKVNSVVLKGDLPDQMRLPTGCVFHGRCIYGNDDCRTTPQVLTPARPGHLVACHLSETLKLRGVT
jgi:oligopeptide/dipeptide ABC transporter ATP-binding protein